MRAGEELLQGRTVQSHWVTWAECLSPSVSQREGMGLEEESLKWACAFTATAPVSVWRLVKRAALHMLRMAGENLPGSACPDANNIPTRCHRRTEAVRKSANAGGFYV